MTSGEARGLNPEAAMGPTVLWRLRRAGRIVVCTEVEAGGNLEVRITYDNLPLAAQRYRRFEDAERWAADARRRWEASGWAPVRSTPFAAA
jgi:hypothetical protein